MSPSLSSIRVVPAAAMAAAGVGKYRYIAMLAEGGMAGVYLAVARGQANFEKLVVVKELHGALAEDPSFVTMFMDEARLAARLNHPNVVQTYEVGSDGDRHFIAMEFLEGVPYLRLLRLRERIPPPLAFHVRVLADTLYGLHYAHELRDFNGAPLHVVHRDVSPQNVMLTWAGGVKVLDFGIAKAELAVEQRPDDFKGKLEYMAPEQALLDPVDRRADIFSVGVMLWEALTRRRMYVRGEDKYARLIAGALPEVLAVRPDAPRRLAQICARALAHDRGHRYATAAEMAHELEEWLDGTTQHVSARDVGAYISEKFAPTRAKIAAAVEAQLAILRQLPDDGPHTIPLSRIPVTEAPPDLSEPPPPFAPSDPPTGSSSAPAAWSRPGGVPFVSAPPPVRQGASRGQVALAAIAGVVGIAVFAAGGALYLHKRAQQQQQQQQNDGAGTVATEATAEAVEPDTAPSAPLVDTAAQAPASIDYTIKASPPEARILIDGKPVDANPASGHVPRDGAEHVVRVEAPGFVAREERVAFDRSMLLTIDLRPDESAKGDEPAKGAPRSRGGARTWRRPAPAPAPRPTSTVGLDTENPYQ